MTDDYLEELINKYAAGTAAEDEIQKLTKWFRSGQDAQDSFIPLIPGDEKQQLYKRMLFRLKKEVSVKNRTVIRISWIKVAAMFLLALSAIALTVFILKPAVNSDIVVTNPSLKIQLVNLPDGSRIWLNASSSLQYFKNFKYSRKIKMEGEAYFEVLHDALHPLSVEAGGVLTTDLGTSFNVKAYRSDNTTKISVINGKVQVVASLNEKATLTPSMQLQFDKRTQVIKIAAIDTTAVLSWKNGRLQFQGETLGEIITTIQNWYGVKIVFSNPGMKSCRYYMNFNNTISIQKLMSAMAEITEMHYVIDDASNTITLSGKECK